jgi:hypothetical protein
MQPGATRGRSELNCDSADLEEIDWSNQQCCWMKQAGEPNSCGEEAAPQKRSYNFASPKVG